MKDAITCRRRPDMRSPQPLKPCVIKAAETDEEIVRCYPVMSELRPRFLATDFLAQVRRQMTEHRFRLVFIEDNGVKAVGSVRTGEWLAGGRYMDIEDLVTTEGERGKGYGGRLFDWIAELARQEDCGQLRLVSRVDRHAAHRFYLNKGMNIEAYYFSKNL